MVRSGGEIETVPACVPIRRSNSASVILGLVKAVRLSGPGIPPRRIALLIEYPPARFPREIVLAGISIEPISSRSTDLARRGSSVQTQPVLTSSPSVILRGFQN